MAILKIARMGHPVLREVASPVTNPASEEIRHLALDMLETMADADGAGLAAPQVHHSIRLMLFFVPGLDLSTPEMPVEGLSALCNPEYEVLSDEMEEGWEGCLSVPGLRGVVPRHRHILYRGFDLKGNIVEREAEGFHARVFQHEYDHLDGILYPARMKDLSLLTFTDELKHGLPTGAPALDAGRQTRQSSGETVSADPQE